MGLILGECPVGEEVQGLMLVTRHLVRTLICPMKGQKTLSKRPSRGQ